MSFSLTIKSNVKIMATIFWNHHWTATLCAMIELSPAPRPSTTVSATNKFQHERTYRSGVGGNIFHSQQAALLQTDREISVSKLNMTYL